IATCGVTPTFMLLGVLYLVLIVSSASQLRMPPAGYAPAGWKGGRAHAAGAAREFTLGKALKTWQWYALWAMLFLNIMPGAAVVPAAAAMAEDVGRVGAATAAALVISNAIGNVAGRVLWSAASDRLGCKAVFAAMFVVQAGALLVLPAAHSFGMLAACAFV